MRRLVVVSSTLFALLFPCGAQAWTWPIDGPVLRPFVFGSDPYAAGQHRGIDVGGAVGASVRAPITGTVSFAGSVPAGGRALTIRTGDGYSVTLLQLGSLAVQRGDEVGEGARVGAVGESSDAITREPHVHLGVRRTVDEDGYLDPLGFLPERPRVVVPAPAPAAVPPPVQPQPAPPPPRVEQSAPAPVAAAPPPVAPAAPTWSGEEPVVAAAERRGRRRVEGRGEGAAGRRGRVRRARRPGAGARSRRAACGRGARAARREPGARAGSCKRRHLDARQGRRVGGAHHAPRGSAPAGARLARRRSRRAPRPLAPAPMAAPARARRVDPRARRDRRVHGHAKGTTYH